MGNNTKGNPGSLTTQIPNRITLRNSLVVRGLREISQYLSTPTGDWSHSAIAGVLSCPSEGFSHPEPAMRFTRFHCELTNTSDVTQTLWEGLAVFRRNRATGELVRVTGDGFGFPASSLQIPAQSTFPPVILELSFLRDTSVEDSVTMLHRDTSELIAHDQMSGAIISIPLHLTEEHRDPLRSTSFEGKRVLIVNDEDVVLRVLCEVLTLANYQCRAVSGGPEALAILKSGECYDLLVHDLLNPHLDGITLLQRTKQHFPELPVIVTSAVDDKSAVIACLHNGAYDYVRLPLDVQHFLNTIADALTDAGLKRAGLRHPRVPSNIRKKVSEMSDEELAIALLTNEQTGLPSERAFREECEKGSAELPYIGHADIDDFKRLRRELGGSESVERLLLQGVGHYLCEAVEKQEGCIRVYHGGGDYFIFRALNEAAFAELIADVNQRLANSFFVITLPDGKIIKRIARKLSKQPQSVYGQTNTGDDWKIEDLAQGSRIIAMSLDEGTILE